MCAPANRKEGEAKVNPSLQVPENISRCEEHPSLGAAGPWILLLLAIGIVAAKGCSQSEAEPPPEQPKYGIIEAESFVVRSPDGTMRAQLGMTAQGRFELVIYDMHGKRRATLAEQGLMLFNAEEKLQARLDLMGDKPRLNLLDAEGRVHYTTP